MITDTLNSGRIYRNICAKDTVKGALASSFARWDKYILIPRKVTGRRGKRIEKNR